MRMEHVKSSNIKAAGYEDGTMRVQFGNGTMYDYKGVSQQMFDGFKFAKSQGRYFNQVIKPKFTGIKVVEEENNDKGTL